MCKKNCTLNQLLINKTMLYSHYYHYFTSMNIEIIITIVFIVSLQLMTVVIQLAFVVNASNHQTVVHTRPENKISYKHWTTLSRDC